MLCLILATPEETATLDSLLPIDSSRFAPYRPEYECDRDHRGA